MRSNSILVLVLCFDDDFSMSLAVELVHDQAFISELPVKARVGEFVNHR